MLGAFIPLLHVLAHVHVHVRGLFSFEIRGLILIGSVPVMVLLLHPSALEAQASEGHTGGYARLAPPRAPRSARIALLSALSV